MNSYSGSDWIKTSLKITNISPLGEKSADLLGDVFLGIYHLNTNSLRKVKWDDKYIIQVNLWLCNLATVDNNELTRLVVLAHDRMMRIEISPRTPRHLQLTITQRESRTGSLMHRCPTMEEHIKIIRNHYND